MSCATFVWSVFFILTGSINTLAAKWENSMSSKGNDGEIMKWNHPLVQTWGLFLGESFCLPLFFLLRYLTKLRERNSPETKDGDSSELVLKKRFTILVFFPSALMEFGATGLLYLALSFTSASSYQMLRGSVIVFTVLYSMLMFRRFLNLKQWVGVALVFIGIAVVSVSDALLERDPADYVLGINSELLGDLLVIASQSLQACQYVFQEKLVKKFKVPSVMAVGSEGIMGLLITTLVLIPAYFTPAEVFGHGSRGVVEDALHAAAQLSNNGLLAFAFFLTVISITMHNIAGVSITIKLDATSRKVIDAVQVLVVLLVSLILRWENFEPLQILGFALLVTGTFVYHGVVIEPLYESLRVACCGKGKGWTGQDIDQDQNAVHA